MRKVIISTIGTSLLTNQIDRQNEQESDWFPQLRDNANLQLDEITNNSVKEIINTLKSRAVNKLNQTNIQYIRRASAELNGIFGIYKDNLEAGKQDIHYLIATDTAQGKATAEIVQNYLQQNNIVNVNIKTPPGLSTASTTAFSEGIDDLIVWFENIINPLKSSNYKIILNLVGGFKSLQGYLNTIGMFYADEIIYIFEGIGSELITIPRLPINIDVSAIAPYKLQLSLLKAGDLSEAEVAGIPEAMIGKIGDRYILSTWGNLIWQQCKTELLSQELLHFKRLEYSDNFRREYKSIKDTKEKVNLQQTLAKVSCLLEESNGDTRVLTDSGLKYDPYEKTDGIDHFRVGRDYRISCKAENGRLILRHYGGKFYVQQKELPNKK